MAFLQKFLCTTSVEPQIRISPMHFDAISRASPQNLEDILALYTVTYCSECERGGKTCCTTKSQALSKVQVPPGIIGHGARTAGRTGRLCRMMVSREPQEKQCVRLGLKRAMYPMPQMNVKVGRCCRPLLSPLNHISGEGTINQNDAPAPSAPAAMIPFCA